MGCEGGGWGVREGYKVGWEGGGGVGVSERKVGCEGDGELSSYPVSLLSCCCFV